MPRHFDRKLSERVLDRSEGTETTTGQPAHSRGRHTHQAAGELATRLKNNTRLTVTSTFLSSADQDRAFAEAMQSPWGQGVLLSTRLNPKDRSRQSATCKIVRNRNITVLVAQVVDRRAKTYVVFEAKLRSVLVVVEGDGRGGVKPVTIFPADHFGIQQRQPVLCSWR